MPLDLNASIDKHYDVVPLERDLIPSRGVKKEHIMWVGCSDSLILETETLGVLSEELFVHRNLGNILSNEDLSSVSAVEWCVDIIKVDHIIVCGHYDCVLIREDADDNALHGWYKDVTKLHVLEEKYLARSPERMHMNEESRDHRFEEVYVLAEVNWLKRQPIVKKAIHERGLQIHALVYDKKTNTSVRLVERERGSLNSIKI